jgi:hypothetical protein
MKKDIVEESFLCLVAGIFMAIAIIAMICEEGNKGLIDLF